MIGVMITTEVGIGQEKHHSQEIIVVSVDRSSSSSKLRSGSGASTNRDRIRCYNCREYDHFSMDCPTSREERDLEKLQQMLNFEEQEEQTHLLTCRQSRPTENYRTHPLKLMNSENGTTAFLPLDSKIGG